MAFDTVLFEITIFQNCLWKTEKRSNDVITFGALKYGVVCSISVWQTHDWICELFQLLHDVSLLELTNSKYRSLGLRIKRADDYP